jgi:predicted ATPase/DNA-binding CsgD family transcriptional regulator
MKDAALRDPGEDGGQIVSLARVKERGRQPRSVLLHRSLKSAAPLVGRQEELALVSELLADPSVRLVSLTGRSGVGKTRLALEVGWALDSSTRGSVRMVSLAGLFDPDMVYAEIASQLQVPRMPGVPLTATLVRWLARSPLVLVVDNFEHLLVAAPLLNDLLDECEDLQLLVTSQSPLRLRAERVIRLAPLPLPEDNVLSPSALLDQPAVALYCDRAKAVNHRFRLNPDNAVAVVAVCRQLEGLPLAIELAAARAATFTAADILDRLSGQRLDVLRSARTDAPNRHQDLRSAIRWTYRLLSLAQQQLLRRLSVIGGWFDIDDAEALGEAEPTQVLDDLSALVDLHLVAVKPDDDTARFELLPSIREFAREELVTSGNLESVEEDWTAWMAGRARSAARDLNRDAPDDSRAWLERAHDRLLHALGMTLNRGRVDQALDLFNGLAPIWANRPLEAAHRRLIERTIELAEDDGRRVAALSEAWAWSALLQIRVLAPDRPDTFVERLRQAEALARSIGDDGRLLHALLCRIRVAPMTGGLARATAALSEGLELSARLGATSWLARFENFQARLLNGRGDDDQAIPIALSSLDHARQVSDTATFLQAAQLLQTMAPHYPQAAAALPPPAELVEMARATHQTVVEAVLVPVLAIQVAATGDTAAAARWCLRGLELSGPDPSSYLAGFALLAAIEIAMANCDLELAARINGRLAESMEQLHAAMNPPFITAHSAAIARLQSELGAERFEILAAQGAAASWRSTFGQLESYLRNIEYQEPSETEVPDAMHEGGLTDRQVEVVRLLARGMSNKEIAGALGVTPKTVMHHTVAIYRRLDLRGRTEVVAWAMKSGLA